MPYVEVQIADADLKRLEDALSPKQFQQATRSAVQKGTTHVRAQVIAAIKKHLAIKPAYLREGKDLIVQRVSKDYPPVGEVIIRNKMVPLIAFKGRVSNRNGAVITVSQDRAPIILKHAFLATMRSGHEGIFLRSKRLPSRGPGATLVDRKGRPKYKLTARGIAGRLAIDEQFGLPLLKLISIPEILDGIKNDGVEFMRRQVESQLSRFGANPTQPPQETPADTQ